MALLEFSPAILIPVNFYLEFVMCVCVQLLGRVKDSGQVLQKRLAQERDQDQGKKDQHTLGTYKVHTPPTTDR